MAQWHKNILARLYTDIGGRDALPRLYDTNFTSSEPFRSCILLIALFDIFDMDRDGEISHDDIERFCDAYGDEVFQGTVLSLMNESVFIQRYPGLVCTFEDIAFMSLNRYDFWRFKYSDYLGSEPIDLTIVRCAYFNPIPIDEFIYSTDNWGTVRALDYILPALFDRSDYVSIASMNAVL